MRISLLAREANGGVYQCVHGRHSHLWLLLIKHDVPLKSAVFHAGTWGDHLYALCWRKMIGNVIANKTEQNHFILSYRNMENTIWKNNSYCWEIWAPWVWFLKMVYHWNPLWEEWKSTFITIRNQYCGYKKKQNIFFSLFIFLKVFFWRNN